MSSINNNDYDYTEREKKVLELYNQGKSTRDIAKELRMSLRDISTILRKNQVSHGIPFPIIDNDDKDNSNKSPNHKSTQAYKLFSEGKKPVEVAIQLGLSEKQATRYCREYWELKGLHELTFLYEERKHYLPSFIRLHNIMQRQGIDDENDIANVLKYAKELPNLQRYCQTLQNQVQDLKYQNQKLERELQARTRNIAELTEVENMHHQNIDTLQSDIDRLLNERRQLQQFVSMFKNGNGKYLQIRRIAEEVVDRLLTEEEVFLDLALKAVIEALRMNPDRYAIIYNSEYDNSNGVFDSSSTNTAAAISPPYTSSASIMSYQNRHYNKYHEGILELAKGFLKLLLNQLVDKTMIAAVKEQ